MILTLDVQGRDVEGFMAELQACQRVFQDCLARSAARGHCWAYLVGPYRPLARPSLAPMALAVEGGRLRSLQRFRRETVWAEAQRRWH